MVFEEFPPSVRLSVREAKTCFHSIIRGVIKYYSEKYILACRCFCSIKKDIPFFLKNATRDLPLLLDLCVVNLGATLNCKQSPCLFERSHLNTHSHRKVKTVRKSAENNRKLLSHGPRKDLFLCNNCRFIGWRTKPKNSQNSKNFIVKVYIWITKD